MANNQEMAPDRPNKKETAEELKRIKEEAQSFSNPLIDPSTEQLSALSSKERRSIEKRIANRKTKIDTILSELESAETADALRKLLFDGNKITDISKLLAEQAEIADKSRGVFAHKPFEDSVLAISQFGKTLLERMPTHEPAEPSAILQQLRGLIPSLAEQKPPATDTAEQKPSEGGQTEESHPQQDNQEKAPIFDDIETIEGLIERLRGSPNWETEIEWEPGLKPGFEKNRSIAQMLDAQAKKLEALQAAKNPNTTQRATEFVSHFVNQSLRDAVRRVFIAKGYLTAEQTTPKRSAEPEIKEAEIPPDFDGITNVEALIMRLRETPQWRTERTAISGGEKIWRNEAIATVLESQIGQFETLKERNSPLLERRVNSFIGSFVNSSLREAIRRGLATRGLPVSPAASQKPQEQPTVHGGQNRPTTATHEAGEMGETVSVREGISLEQIIADVSNAPSLGRKHGLKTIAVSGKDVAEDIRRFTNLLQGEKFRNLPKDEQVSKILDFVTLLTSNTRLQADLRKAFSNMGLLENKGAITSPSVPPASRMPEVSKVPEVQKTPEARKAEALSDYFKKVESGTDFLQRIISMPEDNGLRGSMHLSGLERLSGELSQKVIDFFALIETWERDKKSAKEMGRSKEEFITSHTVPSGCQTAFRTIALFAINKILGPVAETLKASRETEPSAPPPPPPPPPPPQPPAPATGGAVGGVPFSYRPLSVDEVLDNLVKGAPAPAHAAPQATETAPATESPKAAPASEVEAESFLKRVRARGSRLWNPTQESAPKAPPPAPPKAESAPTPPTPPQAAETAPPEKPKLGAEVPLMITREMEEQLAKRGLTTEDINKLKPEEAWKILNSGEASETAAETGAITSLTREKIEALTFENLADLNDDELQAVVGATTLVSAGSWGTMMQGMPDSLVKRVRRAVNNQDYFDEMLKGPVETAERLRDLREIHIRYAKDALLKAIQRGSPSRTEMSEVTPTILPGVPEAPPPAPSSVETAVEQKELAFDDLGKLGGISLSRLYFSAEVREKSALTIVLSVHNDLREAMLATLSKKENEEVEQEIAALGSRTEPEVRDAERVIVETARKLQQDGGLSIPPSAEAIVASGLTPEKIQSLTWENLFELDDDSLRVVVRVSDRSSHSWGSLMKKMPEPLIPRVRACVDNQNNFDAGVNYESKNTAEDERKYRENNVWYAKRELLRILQQENPPQS